MMMRPLRYLALSLLVVAGSPAVDDASAQSVKPHGIQVEASGHATSLLGGAFPYDETGVGVQGAVRYLWPSGVSLGLGGVYAQPEDRSLASSNPRKYMEKYGPYAEVRYQIPDLGAVRPYAGVRLGWERLAAEHIEGASGSGVTGGMLIGTEVWATDRIGFRVSGAASAFTASGLVENASTSGQAWSVEAGLTYFFGSAERDSDGDGVRDGTDVCPDTPRGVEVTAEGCQPDEDGDGRPDLRDACPGTPEGLPVDDRGCALDGDGDGVPDGRDQCAGTPAGLSVDDAGCAADGDGDGVPDGLDACPDTPSGSEVGPRGCSLDGDGDGVPDGRDRCPTTLREADVDQEGCSDVQVGLRDGRYTLPGLPFRFRDVQVNEELEEKLEQMGRELERSPSLSVQIRVYTDTLGPASYNQKMSQRLATAARDFVLRHYPDVDRSRVEAVGMGDAESQGAGGGDGGGPSRVVFIVRSRDQGGGTP